MHRWEDPPATQSTAEGARELGNLVKQGVSWPLVPAGALARVTAAYIMSHGSGGKCSGAGLAQGLGSTSAAARTSTAMPHHADSRGSYQSP